MEWMDARSEQLNPAGDNVGPGDNFDTGEQAAALAGRGDDPATAQAKVTHALTQTGQCVLVRCRSKLDLDRQDLPACHYQQVNLGPRLGSPEEHLRMDELTSCERCQLLDDQPFKRGAASGPGSQLARLAQA